MHEIYEMCLIATAIFIVLAFVCDLIVVTLRHKALAAQQSQQHSAHTAKQPAMAGAGGAAPAEPTAPDAAELNDPVDAHAPAVPAAAMPAGGKARNLAWYGTAFSVFALTAMSVALVLRVIQTGHGPFTNQHEFAVSFVWGVLVAYVFFLLRYQVRALSLVVLPVSLAILLYAMTTDSEIRPLIPALQNNFLLTLHVATAVLAYGAAAVAFGAAVLYLIRPKLRTRLLPSRDLLDEVGYRAGVLTFPLLTIMIVLGAIWAEIAWARYWSWDPKETAALVTWLIYGAYLHARVVRDWRGNKAAWLLILGFAAVLFTYFGNLFLGGLHAYA